MSQFTGFNVAALDFYEDLEADNSKTFWDAHKSVYDEHVRNPVVALLAGLEEEFGAAKVFRPYRDVRFSKDKTPYKTQQGAFVAKGISTGWYLQLDPSGFRTGAGFYRAEADALARYRRAVVDERYGKALQKILAKLTKAGWVVGGATLKTTPRGFDADQPRIELLRHKSLTVGKSYGFEPIIHTAKLADAVRADWHQTRPLVEWVAEHATGEQA